MTSKGPIFRISVSFSDHSHLIGKKGMAHKQLQAATKTLVHFPDLGETDKKSNLQALDEVIVLPGDESLRNEPWNCETELVKLFADCRLYIRQNQLLIYRLLLPILPGGLDLEIYRKLLNISSQARTECIQVVTKTISSHLLIAVRGIMSQSAAVIRIVTELQKLHSGTCVYTTMHLPSSRWRDLVVQSGNEVIHQFDLPNAPREAALASYLCTVGVLLQFYDEDLISVSGRDAALVLEVQQRLTRALPISLILLPSGAPHQLSLLGCNAQDPLVSEGLRSLLGVRVNCLTDSCRRRIILETHEANFAALFEARWLLDLQDPRGLLNRWMRLRSMWPSAESSDLPACLRSPRAFAQLEGTCGLMMMLTEPMMLPTGKISPASDSCSTVITDLTHMFSSACSLISEPAVPQQPTTAPISSPETDKTAACRDAEASSSFSDSGLGSSGFWDSMLADD